MRIILSVTAGFMMLMQQMMPAHAASIVTNWLDDALPAANEVAWEPTIGSRFLAILQTAIYDAWTAYDPMAVGVVSGTTLKNQGGANNEANKREAISYAAYTVLCALAPQRRRALAERMQSLGYEPAANTPPASVGRRAAYGVLAWRRTDGSNEANNFADTTGYVPAKSGAPDAWQPIDFLGRPQLPMTPHWSRVIPFALSRADQFRPIPPPAPGTVEWSRQIDLLIHASSALSDSQKAAAEYWAPWGSSPAPHLLELTKFASNLSDLRLDDDVKLFFVVANAIFDASIATWDAKYVYNYVRPITAIRALGNVPIKTWRPRSLPTAFAYSTPLTRSSIYQTSETPGAGLAEIQASEWEPYLPTPAFPAYVSGHSAFTAAWARAMELEIGRPDLNFSATVKHLFVEQRDLAEPVTLSYPTFASAAEASGISRIWGGIHWPADNERGQELGREVGENTWRRAQQFFNGTASPAAAIFATLRRPYWTYDSKVADRPARFQTARGLEVDLTSGSVGTWQSVTADPMPNGAYQLTMSVGVKGGQPIRFRVQVEGLGSNNTLLGTGETVISPSESPRKFTTSWTSNGAQAFRVSLEASSETANGQLLVSDMSATRVGPTVGGSPRYYEMSSASLPGQ